MPRLKLRYSRNNAPGQLKQSEIASMGYLRRRSRWNEGLYLDYTLGGQPRGNPYRISDRGCWSRGSIPHVYKLVRGNNLVWSSLGDAPSWLTANWDKPKDLCRDHKRDRSYCRWRCRVSLIFPDGNIFTIFPRRFGIFCGSRPPRYFTCRM